MKEAAPGGGVMAARQPPAAELTAAQAERLLPVMRSHYGEGCNNEAMRVLSDVGQSEDLVNGLKASSPMAPPLLDTTLSRLSRCVIFPVDRCAEARDVLRHYFPWVALDCARETSDASRGAAPPTALQPGVAAAFQVCAASARPLPTVESALIPPARHAWQAQSALDELVHGFASALFEEQAATTTARQPRPTTPAPRQHHALCFGSCALRSLRRTARRSWRR